MVFGFERGALIGGVYRVLEPLGRGGMGVVFRAHDEQLERDVAIKLIRPELLNDELRARFLAEARAMARVSHPNVLPVYSFGEHEGAPYFVTQVVRGQTVESWIRGYPPGTAPDQEIAFKILDEACRGVTAIHAADTVHRDLKPGNLLLDETFGVRVADMGVAALLWTEKWLDQPELVGTPEYMAPEAVLQSTIAPELAHRVDVYALGCLAFELFTGTTPFPAKTALSRMLAHVREPPPRPSARRPTLSAALDNVILAALTKSPAERTASAEVFRRQLGMVRSKSQEPVRILLADDDDDFRELLAETLRGEFPDAQVECVSDGAAALEAFDRRQHSVAIVDLRMPKIGGTELILQLRAKHVARKVPIVVLTGSGGPAEWKQLAELGADGFLVKPVHVKDVATVVRRALSERVREVELEEAASALSDHDAETVRVVRPRQVAEPPALAAGAGGMRHH